MEMSKDVLGLKKGGGVSKSGILQGEQNQTWGSKIPPSPRLKIDPTFGK